MISMTIDEIKTPEDILEFMKEHIKYGWLDINNEEHIDNLNNFRRLYRTASTSEVLERWLWTCIEQVKLMSELLNKIHIPNKMYCTRVYEWDDFDDLDTDQHMHCFVLYFLNWKTYQIEHPNSERVGIYEYSSEEDAVKQLKNYYESLSDGMARPVTEFFEVQANLSFKEFNSYINGLDKK